MSATPLTKAIEISTDKSRLQLHVIHEFLQKESYWAGNIPLEVVKQSVAHSFCFGVYLQQAQIGFARIVTDHTTFAYLCDVFVLEPYRGQGVSKKLMQHIMSHPLLQGLRRWMLATRDAHDLYKQFGFTVLAHPDRLMEITRPNLYMPQAE